MARNIGAGISHNEIVHENSQYPFYVSGTINVSADIGKAVTPDAAVAYTVKLAGDGDWVLGRLAVYEDRVSEGIKVGTVSVDGGFNLTKSANVNIPNGSIVVGAGDGLVKALASVVNVVNNAVTVPANGGRLLVVDNPDTTHVTVISV